MPNRFLIAAAALAIASPAAAGVKEGVEKWQAGDHKGAVVEWLPYAAKGDPDALFNLGQAYKLGRGVPMDKAKAEDFYRRAADKGHAPAQSNLGIVLAQRGEKAAAAELWKKAAGKRDARAQYMLGVLHFNGDTVAKDWPLAYAYMMQANNAGLPQAQRALSTMNANLSQADRDAGTKLAATMSATDKLAASGKPVAAPRRIANDIAVQAKAPADKAPAPSQVVETKPVPPTPIRFAGSSDQPRAVVASAPVPGPDAAKAATRGWRVQMGAYSQEARAREAWAALRREASSLVGGVEPHYVAANNVVRLQLGSFADSKAAGMLCNQLKADGRACFVVEAN